MDAKATTPAITIEDALKDRQLLGAALGSPATWQTWLTVLKATFGLALNRQELRAFASIAGSRQPPAERVRELWALAGRGGGKSRVAAAVAVYIAAFIEHDLDPGEVGYVLTLAASRDQAAIVFQYAHAFLRKSPILRKMIKRATAFEILLSNRVVIAVHSNSFRNVRGKALLACIFDETAFWRDEQSANPDVETYRAVLPSLARTGGMLIGISTPYRKTGLLFAKCRDHYDKDNDDVLVVRGSTQTFNPTISQKVIAKAIADDAEGARSEWSAEFRSDISALFDEAVIEDAIDYSRPLELPPRHGLRYFAFTDASAGRNDAFTLTIGHCEGPKDEASWTCDVARGRLAPFDPRSVVQEYAALVRAYGCSKVVGDNFSGEWVASAFADAGIKYETSPLNKSQLYLESLPHFNRGAVSIPEQDRLLRELRTLERRVQRSGRDSVDHPKHGSDDYANALCGALYIAMHELRRPRGRMGAIGVDGRIFWHDEEKPPLRIVPVTPEEYRRRNGIV
jgi:hypothetical protein